MVIDANTALRMCELDEERVGQAPRLQALDLGHRLVPYGEGWQIQRQLHSEVVAGQTAPTILMLEHAPTYTAGTRTEPEDRPDGDAAVVEVDRGGRITWHGPGQLVAYPIVPLAHPLDVVAFVRAIEDAIMATLNEYGLASQRVDGRSGVWMRTPGQVDRKIAAIGVRVARGVAMHGLALNVNCDLEAYEAIVPCGIRDATVTSMKAEGRADVTVADVAPTLGSHLVERLTWS